MCSSSGFRQGSGRVVVIGAVSVAPYRRKRCLHRTDLIVPGAPDQDLRASVRRHPCPRHDNGSRWWRSHETRNRVRVMCKPGSACHNVPFVTKPRSHRATRCGSMGSRKINGCPSRETVLLSHLAPLRGCPELPQPLSFPPVGPDDPQAARRNLPGANPATQRPVPQLVR